MTVSMGILGVAVSLYALTQPSESDAGQISGLMAGLSDHSKAPVDVLDPNLSPSDRDKSLHHFIAPRYELSLVPTGGIPVVSGDFASVPVRVHFEASDGNSLDASATAKFVKRDGVWYFANFDFMSWPAYLIIVLVVCLFVGVSYAVTVLILTRKLIQKGQFGVTGIKAFVPFLWPSLFRQIR